MSEQNERPLAGSLFSGVGGVDLGAERAGFKTAWTAEIDPQARAVLRRHFPDAEHMEDVRDVGTEQKGVDFLSGGFPCQDLSVAGHRRGLDGSRSGLWFEFRRVIAETAPEWVLIENVPGLLSSNNGEDFAVLLEGLAGWRPAVPDDGWSNAGWIGANGPRLYGAVWRVLDTQNFGVPQRRRRVFIVARAGGICPPEVLLEREGLSGYSHTSRSSRKASAGSTESGAGGDGDGEGLMDEDLLIFTPGNLKRDAGPRPGGKVAPTLAAATGDQRAHVLEEDDDDEDEIIGFTKQGGYDIRGVKEDEAVGTLTLDQGSYSGVFVEDDEDDEESDDGVVTVDMAGGTPDDREDVDHAADVSGALHTWLDNPIGDGNDERTVVQAARPRRLTPVECERLQSFPDGWTEWGVDEEGERDDMADTPRYRMMGNAVSVVVAEWICRRILAVWRGKDPDEAVAGLPERYLMEVTDAVRSGARDEEAERTGNVEGFDVYNQASTGDVAHTLSTERAPVKFEIPPAVLRMRDGKEGGGKGALVRENQSLTLAARNDQTVFETDDDEEK